MDTQKFILELADKLGSDTKTIVVLVVLVAPIINWIGALTLFYIILSSVRKIVFGCVRSIRIVERLAPSSGVSLPVVLDSEFAAISKKVDELLAKP